MWFWGLGAVAMIWLIWIGEIDMPYWLAVVWLLPMALFYYEIR